MENKVMGPAIALIVLGILGVFLTIPGFFVGFIDPRLLEQMDLPIDSRARDQMNEAFQKAIEGSSIVMSLVFVVVNVFITWAGVRMLSMKSWTAAVIANVVVMIACLFQCCCCPIGLPIGVWGLVVLFDGNVKQAFEAKAAA